MPRQSTGGSSNPEFSELELAAIGEYLPELQRSLQDQRILKTYLWIAFAVGLAAHVAGYMLRSAQPTEPVSLLTDLLYAFGFALWTGVVVTVFVEILPAAKRRQVERALKAYDQRTRERRPIEPRPASPQPNQASTNKGDGDL